MAKKKKDKITVSFIDEPASEDVTGSMLFISTPNHNILLDAGLYQSNNRYHDFLVNNRKFHRFKPKDIDLIFFTHNHADHCLLAPKLYRDGCRARTIVPDQTKGVLKIMADDSAEINERDVLIINNQHNKNYAPLYTSVDVETFINHVDEFKPMIQHSIDDEISFTFYPSGHLLGSCQILLSITVHNVTKKILITGDIGNYGVHNYYVGQFIPVPAADYVIGESTYGDRPDIKIGIKERQTDISKLKSIIDHWVCEMHGRVLIPTFAQSRLQQLVTIIYNLYKDDPSFKYKVYVDSPLSIQVFKDYLNSTDTDEQKLLRDIISWKQLVFVENSEDSKALISSLEPAIILSTSGMCQVGRVRHHLKSLVGRPNAAIVFVGFSTEGSLASLLKDPKRKTITIDTKVYKVMCGSYSLKSFSGHAPFANLVDYYSSINCQKIILHHGSNAAKLTLKPTLENSYADKCKSTRVVIANSSLEISI